MRKTAILSFVVVLFSFCGAMARPVPHSPAQDEKQTMPQLNGLVVPDPPALGADGNAFDITESLRAPIGGILGYLATAPISNIEQLNHRESQPNRVYWHTSPGGDFCHYRDFEGNHWYGWVDQDRFHWVLYKADRFWWNDSYAGRWLYLDQGNWWWTDEQPFRQARLYLDGGYYPCDAGGVILSADLVERPGEIVSGNGPFQGDFAPAGGHGASHGHGGHHGGGQGGHHEGGPGNRQGGNQGNPTGL